MQVTDAEPRGMIAVKGDLGDAELGAAVRAVSGTDLPGPGEAVEGAGGAVFWMAPDELLVVVEASRCGDALASLRSGTEGRHVLVEDVSDMRAAFVLDGPEVRDLLARVTPADVSAVALPPGRVRRTRIGQVAAAIWLRGEGRAEVFCFRSVGHYMQALLCDAAAGEPLGLHHVDRGG